MLPRETNFRFKTHTQTESEEKEKDVPCKRERRETWGCQAYTRQNRLEDKEGRYLMIEGGQSNKRI